MAAKRKVSNARYGRRQSVSRKQVGQGSTNVSFPLKEMDTSFKERAKRHKRALEEHHQSKVQDLEVDLHNRVLISRRSIATHRVTRIKRLIELTKRRSEIESLILSNMQRLNDSCGYVASDLQALIHLAGDYLELF